MSAVRAGRLWPRPCRQLKKEHSVDLVIANAENASGGSGLTPKNAEELLSLGVDVITMGDHVWDKPELFAFLQEHPQKIIRPANFPDRRSGGRLDYRNRGQWC